MAYDAQTPRRSKRFQPFVSTILGGDEAEDVILWLGPPVHERETRALDVYEENVYEEEEGATTTFYEGFRRRERRAGVSEEEQSYRVADTVLVKTQSKLPSVGVIIAMWEVHAKDKEGEPIIFRKVKIHWFLRPNELPSVRVKREYLDNEIYFSLSSTAVLPPNSILQHCTVSSNKRSQHYGAERAKKSKAPGSIVNFYCRTAVNALRGLHYGFDWERHKQEARTSEDAAEGDAWAVTIEQTHTKRKKRRNAQPDTSDDENNEDTQDEYDPVGSGDIEADDGDEEIDELNGDENSESQPENVQSDDEDAANEEVFATPLKRRKAHVVATPRKTKRKRTVAAPTPHSRAALRARARSKRAPVRAPTEITLDFMSAGKEKLPSDPWLRTMQVLHVGSRPDILPCREEEFARILRSVESLLEEGSGGCVYVSGVPGTGKTATVHRIVRELKHMAERNEANPFTYVEINGLRIPEPLAAYCLLWEAVSGHDAASEGHLKISPKEALKQLTKYFSSGARAGPAGHACVVLMDELDQLLTSKQEVVYNFFNWPTLVGSRLVVIAVANTHDLPERVMTGRVRSRLGMTRINFSPYDKNQLMQIVETRLRTAREGIEDGGAEAILPDAIKFAAAKVASVSGDARRVLDICRRAVELVRPQKKAAHLEDVKEVIKLMQNSHTAAYLGDCSLHERIMLAALLKCIKRDGIEEISWEDVRRQHLNYTGILPGDGESLRKPADAELRIVLDALQAAHAVLVEDISGAAASGRSRRRLLLEGEQKIILNIEQSEVQRVLSDIGGPRWKNALGI